jgi:UDP-N-acetylmuramate--alanine ligase
MSGAPQKIHFVGVAGTGMSALAQLRAAEGCVVTGSDRQADGGGMGETGRRLEAAGVTVFPQDGSGIDRATTRVVVSTAIEKDNLDLARAAEFGVPVVHRADELGAVAGARRTIAVAGTSGKSTVTAMIFHILESAGKKPSLVTGAALPSVRRKGLIGNAWLGTSDLLVIEADESDGTIDRYKPHLGLLLNISKDHKEMPELLALFAVFKARSDTFVLNADASGLDSFLPGAKTFGFKAGELRADRLELSAEACRFFVKDVEFRIPMTGGYNAENALAAAAAAAEIGVSLEESAAALATFAGVARRFELVGTAAGVTVIDDFAHNPEKVRAALGAAHLRAARVLAVFQLHGFAPARFLKKEFIAAFTESLRDDDLIFFPDIYYAGGTAAKDISARDYAEALTTAGRSAVYAPDRSALSDEIASRARPGDLVLSMGARDPSLSDFAHQILAALKRRDRI